MKERDGAASAVDQRRPVRVLAVIPGIGGNGGAERSLLEMAPPLVRAGIDLGVAYFEERPGIGRELLNDHGIATYRIESSGLLSRVRRLRSLIRERRIDIVHATLWQANIVSRFAAFRTDAALLSSLVSTSYGPERMADPDLRRWRIELIRWLDIVTLHLAVDHVHANSLAVGAAAEARLHVRPSRLTVIPRGRDRRRLRWPGPARRALARRELGIENDDQLIVTTGRHEYAKAHDLLVVAFSRVREEFPRAQLWIAGREGATTGRLQAQIVQHGLTDSVRLLGVRDDVPELLAAADCFAFPSRFEGMPGALLEAMAMHLPIVASAIAPHLELLDAESAILIARDDIEALAGGIVEVLTNRSQAMERAHHAFIRFGREFSLDKAVHDTTDLYFQLARRHR